MPLADGPSAEPGKALSMDPSEARSLLQGRCKQSFPRMPAATHGRHHVAHDVVDEGAGYKVSHQRGPQHDDLHLGIGICILHVMHIIEQIGGAAVLLNCVYFTTSLRTCSTTSSCSSDTSSTPPCPTATLHITRRGETSAGHGATSA